MNSFQVQSDQSSTATRVVHPLDLSGVQEGDLEATGATTELQHLSDTPTGARLIPIDGERVAGKLIDSYRSYYE